MIRKLAWVTIGLVFVARLSIAAPAPFDARFAVVKIQGDCEVKISGEMLYRPAVEGRTYQYGTTVRTGRKASCVIRFSEGNECRVLAKAELIVSEDARDKKMKTIKLAEGKINVKLDPAFHQNNDLKVETPVAICGAIGCDFTIEVDPGLGTIKVTFSCAEGSINLTGDYFSIGTMDGGDALAIFRSRFGDHITIDPITGRFTVNFNDPSGRTPSLDAGENTVIDIWASIVGTGNQANVEAKVKKEDGTEQTFLFTAKTEASGVVVGPRTTTTTTTTTTSTTTTTQPPDATPVGKR